MIYRRYVTPRGWDEMARMHRDVARLMHGFDADRRFAPAFPAVNAWTNEDEEIVSAELPGVSPEDIEITVVDDVLTLSGERKALAPGEDGEYRRREWAEGKFSRSIQLAFTVDSEQVTAEYKDGILTIKLPRAETDKPRKIAVKAA